MVMRTLAELERRRLDFGGEMAAWRLQALRRLDRANLRTAAAVHRLHEVLCFVRAYPDSLAVQAQAAHMLERFAQRADLRGHAHALANSGIAGTPIHFRFFAGQAQWLAAHWPQHLTLDRRDRSAESRLAAALTVLLTPTEGIALRESPRPAYTMLDRLRSRRGPARAHETDAAFLLRRLARLPGNGFTREAFADAIDASFTLAPAAGTPSRSTAHWPKAPVAFRQASPPRGRPDLRAQWLRPPSRIRRLSMVDGQAVIDLARAAMVTRERSLEAFSFADARDTWWVDDGDGLGFAFTGVIPERRHAVFSYYGALTLRNGVPIGYTQADVLGTSAALSFNTFETFRGAEAAFTFARWLAALRALFGTSHFTIEPYQLGDHNDEAIASGAWWFYAKLGLAPRDADALALMRREQLHRSRQPTWRSSAKTLQRLAAHHLYLDQGGARALVTPAIVGDAVGAALSARAGSDREHALDLQVAELNRLCGLASSWPKAAGVREAWRRLAPLLLMLRPQRWPDADRRALPLLAQAKAGGSERAFVAAWQAHPRVDTAMLKHLGRH